VAIALSHREKSQDNDKLRVILHPLSYYFLQIVSYTPRLILSGICRIMIHRYYSGIAEIKTKDIWMLPWQGWSKHIL